MMIKKELNRQYIMVEDTCQEDNFSLQMLLENNIPGLIACKRQTFNGEMLLYYDITGKRALSDYPKKLGVDDIKELLHAVYLCIRSLNSYFLSADFICFSPDTIFEEKGKWYFCYFVNEKQQAGAYELAKTLLEMVNPTDECAAVIAYQFYQGITQKNGTLAAMIEDILYPKDTQETASFSQADAEDETYGASEEGGCCLSHMYDENKTAGENLNKEDDKIVQEGVEENQNRPQSENRPDKIAIVIFVLLFLVSLMAGLLLVIRQKIVSVSGFLGYREGILSVCFFALGIIGLFGNLFPLLYSAFHIRRKPQDIEDDDPFEIPSIDKI